SVPLGHFIFLSVPDRRLRAGAGLRVFTKTGDEVARSARRALPTRRKSELSKDNIPYKTIIRHIQS
ncbi:MAG: hypothetical protein ABSG53_27370, partial [Thermoguttaceae bacterium]